MEMRIFPIKNAPSSVLRVAKQIKKDYYTDGRLKFFGTSAIDGALCLFFEACCCVINKTGPAEFDIDAEFWDSVPEITTTERGMFVRIVPSL